MVSEVRRGLSRVLTNYGRLISTLLLAIIEVPLLIYWIGSEAFGLVALLGPTIGLAGIVQGIVSTSMIRELGSAFHSGDRAFFLRTYRACWLISVSVAVLTLFLYLGIILFLIPSLEIAPELVGPAQIFATASGLFTCFDIAMAPTFNLYVISERFTFQNLWLFGKRACYPFSAVVLLFVLGRNDTGQSVAAYGFMANAGNFFLLLGAVFLQWARDPALLPKPLHADWATIKGILSTFGWNSVVVASIGVADRVPHLFVNVWFGLFGNAVYGIAFRLAAYTRMITVGATYGLSAVSTRLSSKDDSDEVIPTFIHHTTRVHSFVAFPAAVFIALLVEPLLTLWVARGRPNAIDLVPPAIGVARWFVLAMLVRGITEGWIQVLYGAGHVRRYAPFIAFTSLLIPLGIWIALLTMPESIRFESPAIVFGGIALISYLGILPFLGGRILGVHVRTFLSPLVRPLITTLACAPLLVLASQIIDHWTLLALFVTTTIFGGLYVLLSLMIQLTSAERTRFGKRLRGVMRDRLGRGAARRRHSM